MDLPLLAGTLTASATLARTVLGITTDSAVKAATNELINKLNDISLAMNALIAENAQLGARQRDLEDEARSLRKTLSDFARYELARLPSGALAFKLKGAVRQPQEPTHYLCANCWNQSQKQSILQLVASRTEFRCDACKTSLEIHHRSRDNYTVASPVFDPTTGY